MCKAAFFEPRSRCGVCVCLFVADICSKDPRSPFLQSSYKGTIVRPQSNNFFDDDDLVADMPSRELKQNVVRLSGAMRTRKGGTVLSVDMDAIEGSDDAQVAVEEYMSRNTVRTRLSKDIISQGKGPLRYEYNEKTTAAYVAARMPAIYGTIYRVLSEVSDFSHCHGQSLARFSTWFSRLGFSCV